MAVLIAAQGAGDYDPFNDYDTVTAWYSVKDTSTLFQDSAGTTPAGTGDVVGRWADKSGNDYHQLQATTASKPTNTANGVLFDGVNDFMQAAFGVTISQPTTFFFVAKLATVVDGRYYFDGVVTDPNRQAFYLVASTDTAYAGGNLASVSSTTDKIVHSLVFNGSSSLIRRNGSSVATGNTSTNTLTGLTLGSRFSATNTSNLYISELILLPEAAPLAKIQATEAALMAQYGIS